MQFARYFSGSIRTMTWLDRVLVLLVASLLSLQLLGAGHHKDDHAGYSDNCASCFFAHQVPHGLPDVEPAVVPVRMAQVYRLAGPARRQAAPASPRFLIPHAQAPPRA
jgi:hypothetical protein